VGAPRFDRAGFRQFRQYRPGFSHIMRALVRLAPERQMPIFAPSFRGWAKKNNVAVLGNGAGKSGQRGALLDTFNNYFQPQTSRAALEVLQQAGFNVAIPNGHLCCGRPLYDFGMLDRAKRYTTKR